MKESKNNPKERTKTKRIMVAVILSLILLSALGFIFLKYNIYPQKKSQYIGNVTDIIKRDGEIVSYKYNNFQFEKNNNLWITEVQTGKQSYLITFVYGPLVVENISVNFNDSYFNSAIKTGNKIYVTFDHDTKNASYIATAAINMITNLKTVYGLNVSRACMINSTSCAGAPVITCKSNPGNAIIQYVESDVDYALYSENCLTIYGSRDGFIKTTEKIILKWYRIL